MGNKGCYVIIINSYPCRKLILFNACSNNVAFVFRYWSVNECFILHLCSLKRKKKDNYKVREIQAVNMFSVAYYQHRRP